MLLLAAIVTLGALLFGVQELFRRTGKRVAWGCFLVLPLLLTPFWDIPGRYDLFSWIKLYSMLVLTCWLTGVRFTPLGRRQWARFGFVVLGTANVLEAIVQDLLGKSPVHYLNAASGRLTDCHVPIPAGRH